MKTAYYQRVILSDDEMSWGAEYGPGLWVEAFRRQDDDGLFRKLVRAFLNGRAQMGCLGGEPRAIEIVTWFVQLLVQFDINSLAELVKSDGYVLEESVENVPQLSSYESSTSGIVDLLAASEKSLDFSEIGYHLNPNGRKASKIANIKFGENCAKFAALLGLVEIPGRKVVRLSALGSVIKSSTNREVIYPKLFLKIALFRDFVCGDNDESLNRFRATIGSMSESTQARRASAFSIMYKHFVAAGGIVGNKKVAEELLCQMRH